MEKISIEDYRKLHDLSPENRIQEKSRDLLHDRIAGILLLYSKMYVIRDGWIDIITINDAEKEIRQLIEEFGNS